MAGILSWLGLDRKDSQLGRFIYQISMGQPVWTKRDYKKLADEAYVRNVIAHRSIAMVSEAAASVQMTVYEGDADLSEHPFISLLSSPNPYQSGVEFLESVYAFLQISGNGYVEGVTLDGPGDLREVYALRPDWMKVIMGPRGFPVGYEHNVQGQPARFDMPEPGQPAPILHVKLFHPTDAHYGLGRVEPAAYSIDVHNSASAYSKSLLDNRCRPEGALTYTDPTKEGRTLSDKQFENLRKELEETYAGPENAGRPMLLDGGLDWKPFSYSPKDMDMLEARREEARSIALAFGVPPMLLGIPGDNTYSNYKEANLAFYRQTVVPLVRRVAMAMTTWLRPYYGDNFRLEANLDDITALALEREPVWERASRAESFLTVNERRQLLGYEPIDGGDVVMVQSTQVPLEDVGFEPGGPAPEEQDG